VQDSATTGIGSDKSGITFIKARNILANTGRDVGDHLVSEMPDSLT
jgi:hypothetical protein